MSIKHDRKKHLDVVMRAMKKQKMRAYFKAYRAKKKNETLKTSGEIPTQL